MRSEGPFHKLESFFGTSEFFARGFPVAVESMAVKHWRELLAMSNSELQQVDPLVMNLLVAKSIPSQAALDIPFYVALCDVWAEDVRRDLPRAEWNFRQAPDAWDHSIHLAYLAILCEYIDCKLRIAYNEDERRATTVRYTDPSDLFLNGVMDHRRGTCGNMALVHVAIAYRLGWPVALACLPSHYFARFDNGKVVHNLETTNTGRGGFSSPSDEELARKANVSRKVRASGSYLQKLSSQEMLGVFIALRARHLRDIGELVAAERDHALAHYLYPTSRDIYCNMMGLAVPLSDNLFEYGEHGSAISLASWIQQGFPGWREFATKTTLWRLEHSFSSRGVQCSE